MQNLIKVAVDAMGGDDSPEKIIKGIIHNHNKNKDIFFKIFGSENKILEIIKDKIGKEFFEVIHTDEKVESTDSPLEAAKKGKKTTTVSTNMSARSGLVEQNLLVPS